MSKRDNQVVKVCISLYPETLTQLESIAEEYFHLPDMPRSTAISEAIRIAYYHIFGKGFMSI